MTFPPEFVEIEAKSVLNRVVGMPFRWSINPYRGCSHGCPFCLCGETPILMADGTTRCLGDIRIGDQIYGTVQRQNCRRFARTLVLGHWNVEKPAYRITLEDGTQLVASGDHRFLTTSGWKFVTGSEQGVLGRPHLTMNNQLVGTGEFAARDIEGRAVKNHSSTRVVEIERVGARRLFDITTGTGDFVASGVISHNCYARRTHWFLDEDGVDQWSSKIFVKVNAPEVLRRELGKPAWRRERVALGTATDPYQAAEGRYRVTRGILEALRDFHTPVSIVTRSPMVVRDLDVLADMADRVDVHVCLSIATVDPDRARELEPTVAAPAQRLRAVQELSSAGIRTGVLLAPILPGLTDRPESLAAVVRAARDHGAHFVWHNVLHLGEVTKDAFMRYLRQRHPDLVSRYAELYPGKYAPNAYRARVARLVEEEKARAEISEPRYRHPPKEPEQLDLLGAGP